MKGWAYIACFGLILIGAGPMLSMMLAASIADFNGCALNEGNVYPCIILGSDWGSALYTMQMMAWFMMITWPAALLGVAGLVALVGLGLYERLSR